MGTGFLTHGNPAEKAARLQLRQQLFDTMMEAYAAVDMSGTIIDYNHAFLDLLGYSAEEISKLSYSDITPEKWHQFELDILTRQVKTRGFSDVYEKEYRKKDGTIFPVELKTFLIRDQEGHDVAMWAIIRDITDRKRTENALRESMSWWQALYKSSPLPNYVWEESGNDWILTSHNDAAVAFTGGRIRELIGIRASELYAESPEIIKAFADCKQYGVIKTGIQPYVLRTTGKSKFVSVSYTFIPEKYILVTVQDETEMEKKHAALTQSEAHMRVIADAIPGPVSYIGPEGKYVYINRHYEDWFGDAKAEVIGRTPRELLRPDLFEKVEPFFRRVLAGEEVSWETSMTTAAGETRVGQVTHIPDFDAFGSVRGIFSIVFDITKRKQAEEDLRASLAQKEMLLAEVHHRIKNNLQVITALISMQSQLIRDTSAILHLQSLGLRIRAMGLLHTLLYKSFDQGSVPMKTYLPAIAEQVFAVHGSARKNVKFVTDIDDLFLNTETSLPVGLIVNEAISNALKYAFNNVTDPRISLHFKKNADGLLLEIRDNGTGMAANVDKNLSLGLRLINVLTRQIHGILNLTQDHGTQVRIEFREQHKETNRWVREKS